MRKHTPVKTPRKKKKNLYMTRDSVRLKNKKLRLWRKYTKTRGLFDRNNYDQCKNKLRNLTRKLRSDYERKISEGSKEKPKMFWSYAKSRLKTSEQIASLIKPDGTIAKSAEDKAETLNNFFSSVFTVEDIENLPAKPPTYKRHARFNQAQPL